ncbi:GNAT family N-acetyltransferase [Spirosoma sp. KNUC1025]|uniref:GNAT family N-acetyltransferase n=1 Tax=Spirosoma sp. KNUC1025 TaxID=2894082 RepID=UPI00386F704B|nr:GNAT family N-acetyltransferase [Spirosoma sp. KNUC1025]
MNAAKDFQKQLLTVTYIIESDTETIAFFSLLNDKISVLETNNKRAWNRFSRAVPNAKRQRSFPAMKVGRLGVNVSHHGKGIGTVILDYLKQLFIDNNRTGCRFITVDAYHQSLQFYERNGFKYLIEEDEGKDTRLMYFDLSVLV